MLPRDMSSSNGVNSRASEVYGSLRVKQNSSTWGNRLKVAVGVVEVDIRHELSDGKISSLVESKVGMLENFTGPP